MKAIINSIRRKIVLSFSIVLVCAIAAITWTLLAFLADEPRRTIVQQPYASTKLIGCVLAGTLVSILLIRFLASRITSSLSDFAEQVRAIRQTQDKGQAIAINSNDEIGQLAESYNELLAALAAKERQIQATEDRLSRALQGSNDGVWDWDLTTNTVFYSPHFMELLGYAEKEFEPTIDSWALLIHNDDIDLVWDLFRRHFDGNTEFFICEHRIRCGDGNYRWFLARGQAWRGPEGTVVRMAGSLSDISDRKRVEDELVSARLASEAASKAKSDFLATMSHEIRTPMNGILGMAELLAGTVLSQEQREYLKNINLSAENLLAIINDILDFSKVEAGKVELEHIPFRLRTTLGQTIRAMGARLPTRGWNCSSTSRRTLPT